MTPLLSFMFVRYSGDLIVHLIFSIIFVGTGSVLAGVVQRVCGVKLL